MKEVFQLWFFYTLSTTGFRLTIISRMVFMFSSIAASLDLICACSRFRSRMFSSTFSSETLAPRLCICCCLADTSSFMALTVPSLKKKILPLLPFTRYLCQGEKIYPKSGQNFDWNTVYSQLSPFVTKFLFQSITKITVVALISFKTYAAFDIFMG